MKQKFSIPVVFKVKAESEEQARECINQLMQRGFESLSEYERPTWKAIKRWCWAQIRGAK